MLIASQYLPKQCVMCSCQIGNKIGYYNLATPYLWHNVLQVDILLQEIINYDTGK